MKKFFSYLPILFLGFGLLFTGCIDDKFDEPPIDGENPDITTNATIKDILDLWQPGSIVEITDDLIFSAVVVSSDEEGNFYKALVVEDENSGIRFSIAASGLYTSFPQFRRVFVKAKGLYIGDYRNLPTIGAGVGTNNQGNPIIERIPAALVPKYIIKGKKNEPSPIREKTIAEVTSDDVNRLIRLTDVEFVGDDLSKTLADDISSATRQLVDCIDNKMDIRTSNYATFGDAAVPRKHGSIDVVVGIYNTGLQLTLNAFEDIDMKETRCTGGGAVTVGDWTYYGTSAIVDSVREDFNALNSGDDVQLEGWLNATDIANGRFWRAKEYDSDNYIQATAHGDSNPTTHNWVITPGVSDIGSKILSFRSAWGFGDLEHELKVFVSTNFDGIDIGAATWTEINPTIANSATAQHQWVKSGDFPLTAFSGVGYVAFEYTGAVGSNPSALRVDDVVINATGAGVDPNDPVKVGDWYIKGTSAVVSSLNEPFDDIVKGDDYTKAGWINSVKDDADGRFWIGGQYQDDKYVKTSAYTYNHPILEQYLITPGVSDIGSKTLSFKAAMHHYTSDFLSVWISTDFDGTDVGAATWTELSATLPGSAQSDYDWVDSGDIDLSSFSGTGYIAFKFKGDSAPSGTSTTGYHIDDVKIQ